MPAPPPPPQVLVGVLTSPTGHGAGRRARISEWNSHFGAAGVDVRFVVGSAYYNGTRHRTPLGDALLQPPRLPPSDFLVVDGREHLPHVGVATEKSAAWWGSVAAAHPEYAYYCKADDDTLIHLSHLASTVAQLRHELGDGAAVYLGNMKWRGWEPHHRFQACGGVWGGAPATAAHLANRSLCPLAAGPFPYMAGAMVCMSRPLARLLAADGAFGRFVAAARARNDRGVRCRSPAACAAAPAATKMWHHEDAGIGFNVFRAAVAANASIAVAAVPGHNNDVGPFVKPVKCPSPWSRCAAEAAYWSDRAVFTHQVKSAKAYADVAKRWNTTRPLPNVSLACASCSDAKRGPKYGAWTEARLPCTEDDDAFCAVDVGAHFRCCHFEGGFVPPTPPALPRVWRPRRRRKAHTLQPGGVGVELLDGMTRGRVL